LVEAGDLMSYGTSPAEGYYQVGNYAGKILRGLKPSELPVIQSSKFEFVINLQSAKALGLTIPPGLLGRVLINRRRWPGLGRVLINRPAVSAFAQTGHRADIAE
jgi:ABC-type uncharacterized transport system substrate-binding protein